jgi:glycine reductase complex component B subunit gamma
MDLREANIMKFRVVHYINQFYAGKGGEETADYRPDSIDGAVGPGKEFDRVFQTLGSETRVVGTVVCGDGFFGENMETARAECLKRVEAFKPDILIAGPAFNAGRYGVACGDVCATVSEKLGIPVVTAMYPENPGVEIYFKKSYIIPATDSARGMRPAIESMAKLALKLAAKEAMGTAREEGYLHRGVRKNFFKPKNGAERAVDMVLARLRGQEFTTEYEMPVFKRIPPAAPVQDLREATIALVTSGGIVPFGNPDRIRVSSAETYGAYDISKLHDLLPANYESIHGGYDRQWANVDPDVVVPLDVMRDLEKEGVFKKLHPILYTTTGTGTAVSHAERFGQEIGEQLKQAGVSAAILTST